MSEPDPRTAGDGRDLQVKGGTDGSSGNISGLDFEVLAASLRSANSDMPTWFALLGSKLAGALPERVQLHRNGLFSNGAINRIEIDLGALRMALRLEHGHPVAERAHVVRGIALKTEQLSLDVWIISLCQALAALAAASAREQTAIQLLLE
ncbi:MAG: hypothetical protein ACLQUY_09565 [Ktedonobacterales bacterium]